MGVADPEPDMLGSDGNEIELFDPEFEGDPDKPRKPRTRRGRTCSIYPQQNPRKFQIGNKGR